jgi:transglutaminase-like putative cysteine protease
MPREWCWQSGEGGRSGPPGLWTAGFLLAILLATPLPAATLLERTIDVEVRTDGSVLERHRLRVRLDNAADVSNWEVYPILLDQNREIDDLSASAVRPDGKTVNVSRRDLDTHQVASSGELHSSRLIRSVSFPAVPPGSTLALDYSVRERPYFPGGVIELGGDEKTESLRVTVHGAGAGWRYRLDGALPGLTVQEIPGGVTVTGRDLPAITRPERAPDIAAEGAVLRYAWGDLGSWEAVGRWYEGLLAQVPRGAEPVRNKARALIDGVPDRKRRIETLADFARRQVRYVAVEVGIGGYRPTPPQQVMDRLWGDCKDKALLLVDLLKEAGVEAYPALALLDPEGRVDREFPSPFQFNHEIVAVPVQGLDLPPGAPVAGGYLFLDATQEEGGIAWLQPAVQDQEILVVRNGRGELVRTPIHPDQEGRRLDVTLDLGPTGDASGAVHLELSGEIGAAFQHLYRGAKPQETDRAIRRVLGSLLPAGTDLSEIRWQSMDGGVPEARLDAKVKIPTLGASTEGTLPAIPLPGMTEIPAPGLLDGRAVPLVDTPFVSRVTWRVTLPKDGCKSDTADVDVRNDLGAFHQTVALKGRELTLERTSELRRRWIDPGAFPALKEIGLAESRTNKRRLRLGC